MNTYVVDTSVTIAWYLEESFAASARSWQEKMLSAKITLLVPTLHYWEFGDKTEKSHRNRSLASLP
jgi:hypothetical protein